MRRRPLDDARKCAGIDQRRIASAAGAGPRLSLNKAWADISSPNHIVFRTLRAYCGLMNVARSLYNQRSIGAAQPSIEAMTPRDVPGSSYQEISGAVRRQMHFKATPVRPSSRMACFVVGLDRPMEGGQTKARI
jgi:hypothetical protein